MTENKTPEAELKEQPKAMTVSQPTESSVGSADMALLDSTRFVQLQRVATMFANSKLVPDAFKGDIPSCAIAVQMALRMAVDPFMLIQNMYVVHGKPGLEAKFLIAMANTRGPFVGGIKFRLEGEGMERKCTAYATYRHGGACEMVVSMKDARAEGWLDKQGSKWKTIPDLMLRYRSASWLIKTYCPEVTLGLDSSDELMDAPAATWVEVTPTQAVEDDVPLSDKERQIEENRQKGLERFRAKQAAKEAKFKAKAEAAEVVNEQTGEVLPAAEQFDKPKGWDDGATREPGEEG